MGKAFLILLVFGLYEVCSICFIKHNTSDRRQEIDRPKAADEYHCKILCAERKGCLSFAYSDNGCKLFGNKIGSSTGSGNKEWVKKVVDAECPGEIKQPLITAGYVPNPAIEYATEIDAFEFEFNTWQACPKGSMLDITLPDNTHRLEGDRFNHIHWNGKIGSWILTKKTEQSSKNNTTYVRAARCFDTWPDQYTDPKSCGGSLPIMAAVNDRVFDNPVKEYAVTMFCFPFQFITDFDSRAQTMFVDEHVLICIDESWMLLKRSGTSTVEAWKILKGICISPNYFAFNSTGKT